MRICCTGPNGNLGKKLVERGAIPLYSNVLHVDKIRREIKKISPDIIINTASKSKPDWCEDKDNTNEAYNVNVFGIKSLQKVAPKIPIVALSTDYIFTGSVKFIFNLGFTKPGPYKEKDQAYSVNYYGLTKWAMELVAWDLENVKIVRTSNLFWRQDKRATNYIDKLYYQSRVMVPTFQHRSFMHIDHFAESLEQYCERFAEMPKILHISGSKTVHWYDFIRAFADAWDVPESLSKKLKPLRFQDKWPVERPKKAGLNVELSAKLGLPQYDYLDGMKIL